LQRAWWLLRPAVELSPGEGDTVQKASQQLASVLSPPLAPTVLTATLPRPICLFESSSQHPSSSDLPGSPDWAPLSLHNQDPHLQYVLTAQL
jgi:hypothetical protein